MRSSIRGIGLFVAMLLLGSAASADQYAFRITFTDKNSTPFSLSAPLSYLSSRSVARRAAQGITIDSTDLPVNASYIDSVLTITGGKFHEASKWLNTCVVLVTDTSTVHALDSKPFVRSIRLVGVYGTALHKVMSAPVKLTGSAHKSTIYDASYYGNTWRQTALVHGDFLHNSGFTGKGKMIAVLDQGFIGTDSAPGFDSMRNSGRLVDSHNFTFASDNVFADDAHGTEVLSTMAGYVPNTFVGSAPDAMYALYTTEYGDGDQPLELDNLLCATERADSVGVDIVTISLGYDRFDDTARDGQHFYTDLDGKTTVAAKAANIATTKGMLFVATAGNDGTPPIDGWGTHILTPGDADSALTIGATDVSGNVAAITGYGPNAAGRVKPDVCAMGAPAYLITATGTYSSASGTSFSTPQIAGWAACLWQAHPGATPYQLRQAIIHCASSYASPGVQLGYGVPDFQCTQQMLDVTDTPPPFTATNWLIAMPNPFLDEVGIAASPATDGDVSFTMIDISGRVVLSDTRHLYKGYNKPFTLSVPYVPAGVYILKAISSTRQFVLKLDKR